MTSLCTDLFNVSYEILLQILERYFAHTEETDAQLATLANAPITLMGGVLRPLGDLITTLPVGPEHPGRTAGPSFELFYEDDDLMPHRESAWVLLEERLRDASSFCAAVMESSPEDVASALGSVEGTLTAVADSLARHFADWGATSRFLTDGGGAATTASDSAQLSGRTSRCTSRSTSSHCFASATAIRCASRSISGPSTTSRPTPTPSSTGSRPARCHATEHGPRSASPSSAGGSTPANPHSELSGRG